jgi:ubiquinone/menaquinone biosynthesis C-methylase UbiE
VDVEALNDQLAREHPIDDYYAKSPWAIRFVENRRLRIIRDFVGDVDALEVAEVGAGGGHVLRMFPRSRLTAFDVSSVYIEIARRNLAGYDVRFVKGELDTLDVTAESFDRVICTEVLEHVVDPDAVLAAIARIVRPSGLVVVTIPNDPLILRVKKVVRYTPLRWLLGGRVEWGGDRYHLHRWTPTQFEQLLRTHFQVVQRRFAPFALVRIRSCFKCVPRTANPSPIRGTDSGAT